MAVLRRAFPLPALCCLLALCTSAAADVPTTERVSVSTSGDQGDDRSCMPSITPDGRYVAFTSDATNLVPENESLYADVFVRDRLLGTTERVSVSSAGTEANSTCSHPSVSADARYVVFWSRASNLVADDTNGKADVFVRDRLLGTTERVSLNADEVEGNGDSSYPSISADGRCVAFESAATNLVPGDSNGVGDVFVRDRLLGTTERVSLNADEVEGNGDSGLPSISADGRYVAFDSVASNLVPDDTYSQWDVFVRDRDAGSTERVSVSSDEMQANGGSGDACISADGRYVAFDSVASDLVPDDANGAYDVFVRDRLLGTTERVSVNSDEVEGNGLTRGASISADGRFVAFSSLATNLVPGDSNDVADIFVRDRSLGTTERFSVSSTGEEANDSSCVASIRADGRCVAFHSLASNLVPGDTNGRADIFVRDGEEPGFADVPSSHWAYDEVMACFSANIVKGYGDGLYHPEYRVTRDQMAVYTARALVSPSGDAAIPDPEPPPSFSDVPDTQWVYKHIEYAVSQNVVAGYGDGTYKPDLAVDRGQMAVYVARAMVAPGGDAAIPDPVPPASFPDVPDTFWTYKQVEYCLSQSVVSGYGDGLYHPEWVVTRDQMAVYVQRAFQLPIPDRPPAPDFTLQTLDGTQQYRLSELRGRPVAVLFWTSWCTYCGPQAVDLETLYQRYQDQGFLVLGVGLDDPAALDEKAEELGLTFPVGYNPDAGDLYGVYGIPHTFIIDRPGSISASLLGLQPIDTLEAAIQEVL